MEHHFGLRIAKFVLITLAFTAIALHLILSQWIAQAGLAKSPNPAYIHSAYYGPIFVAENKALHDQAYINAEGFTFFHDFHGQFFNVQDGWRATTDQPTHARHILWLFGSSTVFDAEVPDRFTIASYLQRVVGKTYRVENRGIASINAAQQLIILKAQTIQAGDIVVFYDGPNDLFSPVVIQENRRRLGLAIDPMSSVALAQDAYKGYAAAVLAARDYSISRRTQFWHFLEPTAYSLPNPMPFESVFPANAAAYELTWPMFRQTPSTVDLTHLVDELRLRGVAIYLDDGHMNEHGNEAIARAIYSAIFIL